MSIGNGQLVRFWTDIWFPKGRLLEITGALGTQKMGITRNARICDVLVDGVWRLRDGRDQQIAALVQEIKSTPITLNHEADGVKWKLEPDSYGDRFISAEVWQQIRSCKGKVPWSKLVWFPQRVPRYTFITWLAFRDRLSTRHRTSKWGSPQGCLYCGEPDETRDHLFFACPYTYTLWLKVVGNLFGAEPDPDWGITISRLQTGTYDRITFILLRMVLQVTIYYIWRERNDRRHNNTAKPVDQLARIVDKAMRNRISSTRYFLKPKLKDLLCRWFGAHFA
ncbi:uncharacterized protein LOC125582368 [Brassica napus]|uniref:uncharacterized protein LOC125582368 n=1 Tax=Brassica napus TaxID=3708 RepID=UPI0020785146|nr:uncharacterized protein LOC125582368 [Brassica napus]